MDVKKVNDSLFLNITINVVVVTAMGYLMNTSYYKVSYPAFLSEYYSLSIVAFIFLYVLLDFMKDLLNSEQLEVINFYILLNLLVVGLLLLMSMYPNTFINIVGNTLNFLMLVGAISFNVAVPISILSVYSLLYLVFKLYTLLSYITKFSVRVKQKILNYDKITYIFNIVCAIPLKVKTTISSKIESIIFSNTSDNKLKVNFDIAQSIQILIRVLFLILALIQLYISWNSA